MSTVTSSPWTSQKMRPARLWPICTVSGSRRTTKTPAERAVYTPISPRTAETGARTTPSPSISLVNHLDWDYGLPLTVVDDEAKQIPIAPLPEDVSEETGPGSFAQNAMLNFEPQSYKISNVSYEAFFSYTCGGSAERLGSLL